MDQSKDILELSRNSYRIDLDEVAFVGKGSDKKRTARRRWAILAKALKSPSGSQPSSPTDDVSVRRISSFMLLKTRELPAPPSPLVSELLSKRAWFEYSLSVGQNAFSLNISHRTRTFSAEDLMGFNNTGNVCIWPSEETLSYYACSNLDIFKNRNVLELGGGMSCLAGLFVAKYASPKTVLVSDGNKTSVDNVRAILQCNEFSCPTDCAILKWGEPRGSRRLYDVIVSADCLFFDDARRDFVECLYEYLAPEGLGLVMAPQRGSTLDSFMIQSENRGLICRKIMRYDDVVWERRLELLDQCEYNDNIHYPVLVEVTKREAYSKENV
ncbi:calmodulin-lysine N-methyltransferase [Sitophilus oryzae]|uniref:Calmodulin-lysine N-methyltransferase n=1 Tax=Sitophilus oryzae TaxID=7048 RepID=A0A6J2Y8B8_SITOR|nr:calmodulin-lysine N-methyltransferase [Sitophilus oryzae]